ncbi:transposase [Bradyrhizobium sp. NBAIM08]|nr:transposase [Bradyrhizobium sp. NBAIM08]
MSRAFGRRRWSAEVHEGRIAEAFVCGAIVSDFARHRALSPQHLATWRKACATTCLRCRDTSSSLWRERPA